MWEFSIILNQNELEIFEYILSSLDTLSKNFGCILTTHKEDDLVYIIIACDKIEKKRVMFYINDCIVESICTLYKEKFLNSRLQNIFNNDISMIALKNALIAFDRETDKYIVTKYLEMDKNINLESFFNFKLKYLKEKWSELARIANENSSCLISNQTLVELLKFLVDNLDINNEVVNIVEETDKYNFFDINFDAIDIKEKKENSKECSLISNLITLCPKRIVFYYIDQNTSVCNLIKQIFFKKVTFLPIDSLIGKKINKMSNYR